MIIFILEFGGPAADVAPILAPFYSLHTVVATNGTVPYTAGGAGITDPVCQPGDSWQVYPVGLQTYDISTNRAIFNLYKDMVTKNPAMSSSIVQFEGYPQEGVRAVEPDSTAYAHRGDNLLVYAPALSVLVQVSLWLLTKILRDQLASQRARPSRCSKRLWPPGWCHIPCWRYPWAAAQYLCQLCV